MHISEHPDFIVYKCTSCGCEHRAGNCPVCIQHGANTVSVEMPELEFDRRYVVIKLSDIDDAPENLKDDLAAINEWVETARKDAGKPPLECMVIEKDWPEFQPAKTALMSRITESKQ